MASRNHKGQKRKSPSSDSFVQRSLHNSAYWITRGIEIGLVVSSLLWAVEVNASKLNLSLAPDEVIEESSGMEIDRAPAGNSGQKKTVKRSPSHVRLPKFKILVTGPQKVRSSRLSSFEATQFTYSGDGLASSFKSNPYYIPTAVELIRFKTVK